MMVDVKLFGGRGGAARGGVIGIPARGGARNRVPLTNRRLVDSFEASEDYSHLANQLGINYSTARNIIRVWLKDGRVETRWQGGAHNVVVTGVTDEAIREIALAASFTMSRIKQQLLQRFAGVPISVKRGTTMAMASQPNLLARIQTFLSNATLQRQLNDEDSMVSGWQASTSIIG